MSYSVGLNGLIRELQLKVAPPAVRSEVKATARRTIESPEEVLEVYPQTYACGTLQEHLRFALRYEPLDLRVWHRVMDALPSKTITDWVKSQPNSAYARRAWYLYERLRETDHMAQQPLQNPLLQKASHQEQSAGGSRVLSSGSTHEGNQGKAGAELRANGQRADRRNGSGPVSSCRRIPLSK